MTDRAKPHSWEVWNEVSESDLLSIAARFGSPVPDRPDGPLVQRLEVRLPSAANPRSLSAVYGREVLPMHTDGAAHRAPPAVVLLYCKDAGPSPVATHLLPFRSVDLSTDDVSLLVSVPWTVNGGPGRRFLRPVIGTRCVRYDPICMQPPEDRREIATRVSSAIERAEFTSVTLMPKQLLLINNHQVLHGRASASAPDGGSDRTLMRVLVSRSTAA